MKKTKQRVRKVKKLTLKALAIVYKGTHKILLNDLLTSYLIYYDGFVAQEKMYELKGRGKNVDIITCSVTYSLPNKKK